MRRAAVRAAGLALLALAVAAPAPRAHAAPSVGWLSEPAEPGDVVLVYGGDLAGVREVAVWRLGDGDAGAPPTARHAPQAGAQAVRVPSIQPSESSLKLVLPPSLAPGVLALDVGGAVRLAGAPRVEWVQPTKLLPGLGENEAAPGSALQIIGRNLARESAREGARDGGGDRGQEQAREASRAAARARVRVALRGPGGRVVEAQVSAADRYSVVASLPGGLAPGDYAVWVHNGSGGPAGWGGGQAIRIRAATAWPARVFDVRELGARGDDVSDDSGAFRRALEEAERAGGGIVRVPAGTYRLSGTFRLPSRVVLRGEGKDATWLKWPLTAPRSAADFLPAALTGAGEYGLEQLSLMVRNAQVVLRDASGERVARAAAEGGGEAAAERARDVFLRQVRIHYLPYAGRPSARPETDPQWAFARWGIVNSTDRDLALLIGGIRNLELTDSELVGSVRLLDLRNGRIAGNHFSNPMAVSWTDLGGQHLVFERNHVDGVSSWRAGTLPLRYLYGADNVTRNLGRGERESMTFDVNRPLGAVRERGVKVEPWAARVRSASGRTLAVERGDLAPGAYRGFDALIVSGRGAGQYRPVEDNDAQGLRLGGEWDVAPDATSVIVVQRLMGHCIFTRNSGQDVSALLQVWGALYDCTFDGNTAVRSQGLWALGGWFIQWLDNTLDQAMTYHSGIGPTGPTPEGTADYGFLGFTIQGRQTELGKYEHVRAAVLRGNRLSRGHRVLVMWGYGGARKRAGFPVARDVVIAGNRVALSPVGIELDANVEGAVVADNTFADVAQPLRLAAPDKVVVLPGGAGPGATR